MIFVHSSFYLCLSAFTYVFVDLSSFLLVEKKKKKKCFSTSTLSRVLCVCVHAHVHMHACKRFGSLFSPLFSFPLFITYGCPLMTTNFKEGSSPFLNRFYYKIFIKALNKMLILHIRPLALNWSLYAINSFQFSSYHPKLFNSHSLLYFYS